MKLTPVKAVHHTMMKLGDFEIVPWDVSPTNQYEITARVDGCKFSACIFKIRIGDAEPPIYHGWDGNRESPTIKPSIGCDQRCGKHWHITNGNSTP